MHLLTPKYYLSKPLSKTFKQPRRASAFVNTSVLTLTLDCLDLQTEPACHKLTNSKENAVKNFLSLLSVLVFLQDLQRKSWSEKARCYHHIRELKGLLARFWDTDGNRKWVIVSILLTCHHTTTIPLLNIFFAIRDKSYKNLPAAVCISKTRVLKPLKKTITTKKRDTVAVKDYAQWNKVNLCDDCIFHELKKINITPPSDRLL